MYRCQVYDPLWSIGLSETVSIARYQRERAARKEAEHLLEDKSRELYLANSELSEALAKLKDTQAHLVQSEKMASIGQMAAGVAHEINNPIGFVSSNLDSLKHYIVSLTSIIEQDGRLLAECEQVESLKALVSACENTRKQADLDFVLEDLNSLLVESIEGTQRVRQIVADLKDFSHIDQPDMTVIDLHDLIDKTINVAANEIKYKAQIVSEYGKVPPITCYGGKIGQVILNLLVNAAQAIEEQGTITVRTGHESDRVWFEVSDTGRGIPADVLSKIYDPFFTTKKVGEGTGLGLHMVHKIIEAHQGSVNVESSPGVGTAFRVTLPLAYQGVVENNTLEQPPG